MGMGVDSKPFFRSSEQCSTLKSKDCDGSIRTIETALASKSLCREDDGNNNNLNTSSSSGGQCRHKTKEIEPRRYAKMDRRHKPLVNENKYDTVLFIRKTMIETGKVPILVDKASSRRVFRPSRASGHLNATDIGASLTTKMSSRSSKRLKGIRDSMVEKECQLRELIDSRCNEKSTMDSDPEKIVFDLTLVGDTLPSIESSGSTQVLVPPCHSDDSKLCELRVASKQQREKLVTMLSHTKTKVTAEPIVYDDLRSELLSAYDLIEQQSEQIKVLNKEKNEMASSGATHKNEKISHEEELGKDKKILELWNRLTKLEIDRAWGERKLRKRIANDAQEYEKTILNCKKQATEWKDRFEEVWSRSSQAPQPQMETSEQLQVLTAGDVQAKLLLDVMNKDRKKKRKPVHNSNDASRTYETGVDQATLVQDAMNKKACGKLGGGGGGNKVSVDSSADHILLERLIVENDMLTRFPGRGAFHFPILPKTMA